ncbi:MAG: hypothetical protein KIS77_04135 [Saprospiraceae bacterium]|nr:hypothetical protein [Saprospiraceae bacterium]
MQTLPLFQTEEGSLTSLSSQPQPSSFSAGYDDELDEPYEEGEDDEEFMDDYDEDDFEEFSEDDEDFDMGDEDEFDDDLFDDEEEEMGYEEEEEDEK